MFQPSTIFNSKTIPYTANQKQFGENGELEYGWSFNIQEFIVQLYFQLNRVDIHSTKNLENIEIRLREILYFIQNSLRNNILVELYSSYLILLYKLIGHTRDIINGKGERLLSYMMIHVWYDFFPELSFYALYIFVYTDTDCNYTHPYGSWKDLKYFSKYCKDKVGYDDHPLIKECIYLYNYQLRLDYYNFINNNNNNNISLVAKWIPREKSATFGWLFSHLAYNYYNIYIESAKNSLSLYGAKNKCKMEYRKIISLLNSRIDTLEIKQCAKQWNNIKFSNVSSVALFKQQNAFLNRNMNTNIDRINCKLNFLKYNLKGSEINVSRIEIYEFTKRAFSLMERKNKKALNTSTCIKEWENIDIEIDILNKQWKQYSFNKVNLGTLIPIIDLSNSMTDEAKNASIALGIYVAENSFFGKRLIILGSSAHWVNLTNKDTFFDCVEEINRYSVYFDLNKNIYSVFNLCFNAVIKSSIEPEYLDKISYILFSDFQMDAVNFMKQSTFYEKLIKKYRDTGLKMYNKVLEVPSITLWNLRCTNGFPTLSNQTNVNMLSGFNINGLKLISKTNNSIIYNKSKLKTSWIIIQKILNHSRYNILEKKTIEILCHYRYF
jgi:hypothetical protein